MKLKVTGCDTSVEHTKKHIEDKPEGSKEYTFIHFLSPAIVKSGGELVEADTGACLVYSPGHPQHYAGRGKRWSNDWATFTGASAEKLVHEAKVPINRVFYPSRTHFVASLLEKIKYERSKRENQWDNVATMALNEVFIKLARFSKEDAASFPSDHSQNLREIRAEAHDRLSENWPIEEMARMANLSCSRFASLYKNQFGVSPTEDLIRSRIERAKELLSRVRVNVKAISKACGFESVHYFHRSFKKRVGVTPKHYHRVKNPTGVTRIRNDFTLDSLSLDSDYSGIVVITEGEVFFKGNNADWADFLGWPEKQFARKPLMNYVVPDDVSVARMVISQITQGQHVRDIILRLKKKDGTMGLIEFSALSKGKNWFWFARKLHEDELKEY